MPVKELVSGVQVVTTELLRVEKPKIKFPAHFDIRNHMQIVGAEKDGTVVEFIGTDNFAAAWYERQRYEVDAGRDFEPLLYTALYDITEDPTLPRLVPVNRIGPAGVVFEEVKEGGEVKFVTVGQSDFSVPIKQFATGLEYTKALVMFNELWNVAEVERQAGIAFNAKMNAIHFAPILDYAYTSANQTPASSVGANLTEKYLRTIEDAITAASEDTANPRRGPYALLVSPTNRFMVERALTTVFQQGTTVQSSAIGDIQQVIVYNGWTGSRGKKAVTYPGVPANKGYLIDLSYRTRNFKSFVKQNLQATTGNPDVSRFILEQTVWDAWEGVYADPAAAVEEITFPTS